MKILFLLLLFGLTACAPILPANDLPIEPVESPTPQVISLQVTPALEHWLEWVAFCAGEFPNFGVVTQVLPRAALSLEDSDLVLRMGERLDTDPFVAVMGLEEIVVVAGDRVPVDSIQVIELQAIFAGTLTSWSALPVEADHGDALGQPIKVLSYPSGHEIESLFRQIYLDDALIHIEPQVFSTVDFLEKLLDTHPYAIGYLLKSQVPEGIRILEVTSDEPLASRQFVLAITKVDPTEGLKQLLLCLQSSKYCK